MSSSSCVCVCVCMCVCVSDTHSVATLTSILKLGLVGSYLVHPWNPVHTHKHIRHTCPSTSHLSAGLLACLHLRWHMRFITVGALLPGDVASAQGKIDLVSPLSALSAIIVSYSGPLRGAGTSYSWSSYQQCCTVIRFCSTQNTHTHIHIHRM